MIEMGERKLDDGGRKRRKVELLKLGNVICSIALTQIPPSNQTQPLLISNDYRDMIGSVHIISVPNTVCVSVLVDCL